MTMDVNSANPNLMPLLLITEFLLTNVTNWETYEK